MMIVPEWLWEFLTKKRAMEQVDLKGQMVEARIQQVLEQQERMQHQKDRDHWWGIT